MRCIYFLALIFTACADGDSDVINAELSTEGQQDAAVQAVEPMPSEPTSDLVFTSLTGSARFDHETPAEGGVIRLPEDTNEAETEPEEPSDSPDESTAPTLPEGWTEVDGCNLSYTVSQLRVDRSRESEDMFDADLPGPGASHEPLPPFTWRWSDVFPHFNGAGIDDVLADLVMPGYSDDWTVFERGMDWAEPARCYELPHGSFLLATYAAD